MCGKERWVPVYSYKKYRYGGKCVKCAAIAKSIEDFKPLKHITKEGYVVVNLPRDDKFYGMINKATNSVLEHRLVMAKHLGRCLQPIEVVHHIDRDKTNNSIDNLELLNSWQHFLLTSMENKITELMIRVEQLEKENKVLKAQLR